MHNSCGLEIAKLADLLYDPLMNSDPLITDQPGCVGGVRAHAGEQLTAPTVVVVADALLIVALLVLLLLVLIHLWAQHACFRARSPSTLHCDNCGKRHFMEAP